MTEQQNTASNIVSLLIELKEHDLLDTIKEVMVIEHVGDLYMTTTITLQYDENKE